MHLKQKQHNGNFIYLKDYPDFFRHALYFKEENQQQLKRLLLNYDDVYYEVQR